MKTRLKTQLLVLAVIFGPTLVFFPADSYPDSDPVLTSRNQGYEIVVSKHQSFKVALQGDPMKGFNCVCKMVPKGRIKVRDVDMDFETGRIIYIYDAISCGEVTLFYLCQEGEKEEEIKFFLSIE